MISKDSNSGKKGTTRQFLPREGAGSEQAQEKLLAEARALQSFANANVVAVDEVGTDGDLVVVTSKAPQGTTLSEWLSLPREAAEIIRMFADIGQALAAAHEAGLVHRELRPDIIYVDFDGTPRVADFSLHSGVLAIGSDIDPASDAATTAPGQHAPSERSKVYAAPEQRAGQPGDAQSDQYSFCVALRAALTGVAPVEMSPAPMVEPLPMPGMFGGMSANPAAAAEQMPPASELSAEPMPALFGGASATEQKSPIGGLFGAAKGLFSRGGAPAQEPPSFLSAQMPQPASDAPFAPMGPPVEPPSDAPPAPAMFGGMAAGGIAAPEEGPGAGRAHPISPRLRRVIERGASVTPMDRYPSMAELVAELTPKGVQAVMDQALTHPVAVAIAGITPGFIKKRPLIAGGGVLFVLLAVLELRAMFGGPNFKPEASMGAVWNDARRAELDGAFAKSKAPYAKDTAGVVHGGLDAYAKRWLAAAKDALEAQGQSEELTLLRVSCIEDRLLEMEATVKLLVRGDASAVGRGVRAVGELPELESCANAPVLTSVVTMPPDPATQKQVSDLKKQLALAKARLHLGQISKGAEQAKKLVETAEKAGYVPLRADALLTLGRFLAASDDAKGAVASLADAAHQAEQGRDNRLRALALVAVLRLRGELAPTQKQQEEDAEDATAAVTGIGSVEMQAQLEEALTVAHTLGGRFDEAVKHGEASALLWEKARGAEDAQIAEVMEKTAAALHGGGKLEEALKMYDRAKPILEKAYGEQHPEVATLLCNVAKVHAARGNFEAALGESQKALAIDTAARGADHPKTVMCLANLGRFQLDAGKAADAAKSLEKALALSEKSAGAASPQAALVRASLGDVRREQGKVQDAVALHEKALKVNEDKGIDPEQYAANLMGLAEDFLEMKQPEKATPLLDKAIKVLPPTGSPYTAARIRFLLAKSLAKADPKRATQAATTAKTGFDKLGQKKQVAAVEKWLAAKR